MKNIHALSTKESVIGFRNGDYILRLDEPFTQDGNANPLNLYITSDEAIKTGEWCFEVHNGESEAPFDTPKFIDDEDNTWWLRQANANDEAGCKTTKKIVLTTDLKLILDGVQSINFQFLKWFAENPCEYVETDKETFYHNKHGLQPFPDETCKAHVVSYKIIIPKNELKTSDQWQKQYKGLMVMDPDGWDRTNYQYSWFEELITLEEFKQRRMRSTCFGFVDDFAKVADEEFVIETSKATETFANAGAWQCPVSFEAGAKHQAKQMFSLEEVKNIATYAYNFFRRNDLSDNELDEEFETWLNKLGKK